MDSRQNIVIELDRYPTIAAYTGSILENLLTTKIRFAEADPLFFKWQAGEATQAEWQAKREEIRQRFPKE